MKFDYNFPFRSIALLSFASVSLQLLPDNGTQRLRTNNKHRSATITRSRRRYLSLVRYLCIEKERVEKRERERERDEKKGGEGKGGEGEGREIENENDRLGGAKASTRKPHVH